MKKLALAAVMATFVLSGCSTMATDDTRTMVVEVTNAVKPVWILNQVVSKKAE